MTSCGCLVREKVEDRGGGAASRGRVLRGDVEQPVGGHFPHLRDEELAPEHRGGGAEHSGFRRGPHMGRRQVGVQV
jgi:hypothetical protein